MIINPSKKKVDRSKTNAQLLEEKLKSLENTEEFIQSSWFEFDKLITCITDVQDNSVQQFGGFCTIYFEEVAIAFITQIDQPLTRNNRNLIRMCLKVLRMIIERENLEEEVYNSHKPCYDWEPEEWSFYKDSVIKRQNLLCDLGIIHVLGNLISQESILNFRDIQNETVILCIALLLGGNEKA